ncbi:hypothetical protein [Aerolutibacter ruishenii]|uniref:hypothetical protein n=1 Tax=Aerolutibacter ruishenii TaxID=686800 RepID=UPI0011A2C4DA|nr:hypothetical protein [Lysobacter ruishenii]
MSTFSALASLGWRRPDRSPKSKPNRFALELDLTPGVMSHIRSSVIAVALLALSASAAQACQCTNRPEEEKFQEARVVFVGVVRGTQFVPDERVFGGGHIRAVVDVREMLKGDPKPRFDVIDGLPLIGMCSASLRAGIEYVLFLDERNAVSMCNGTRPLGEKTYDRAVQVRELQDLKVRSER